MLDNIVEKCVSLLMTSAFLTLPSIVISLPVSIWIDNRNLRQLCPAIEALGQVGRPTVSPRLREQPCSFPRAMCLS